MAPLFSGTGLLSLERVVDCFKGMKCVWLSGNQKPAPRFSGNLCSDLEAGRTLSFAVEDCPKFCDKCCFQSHSWVAFHPAGFGTRLPKPDDLMAFAHEIMYKPHYRRLR
jgi:hypothetical protein